MLVQFYKAHRFHKEFTQMGHVLRCACHLFLFCIKSHPYFKFSSMLLNCWPTMELPFVVEFIGFDLYRHWGNFLQGGKGVENFKNSLNRFI
jgi:hypothetical protein